MPNGGGGHIDYGDPRPLWQQVRDALDDAKDLRGQNERLRARIEKLEAERDKLLKRLGAKALEET
jgi:hypothetical protein